MTFVIALGLLILVLAGVAAVAWRRERRWRRKAFAYERALEILAQPPDPTPGPGRPLRLVA